MMISSAAQFSQYLAFGNMAQATSVLESVPVQDFPGEAAWRESLSAYSYALNQAGSSSSSTFDTKAAALLSAVDNAEQARSALGDLARGLKALSRTTRVHPGPGFLLAPRPAIEARLQSLLRPPTEERYREFVEARVGEILAHIQEGKDRGLIVSPLGLRDMVEALFRSEPFRRLVSNREILLVVQGEENQERWRKRLEGIFGQRTSGLKEKEIWESDGLTVHLASIHTLARMDGPALRERMTKAGFVILDKEHHIRPIEESGEETEERKRFVRVLVEGGFMTPEFSPRPNPARFLLGLTESVTEGAGRIYGGERGLIFETDLTRLLLMGLVHRPRVDVILPRELRRDVSLHEAWGELKQEERISHLVSLVEAANHSRRSRIVIYANSREEADALAEALEAREAYRGEVSLMISGDPQTEKRRKMDLEKFETGVKRIAIHVETMVEGVDSFQAWPVDAVIFANWVRGGGLRYALQAVGSHLTAGRKPPRMIDTAGMFARHAQLTAFDPKVYILEEGEIRQGSPLGPPKPLPPGPGGRERLKGTESLTMDIFGESVGAFLSRYFKRRRVSAASLALSLDWPQDLTESLVEGQFVPYGREVMERIAAALSLEAREGRRLLYAWAMDRLKVYEGEYPVPKDLVRNEQKVLRAVRFRIILERSGNLEGIEGVMPQTMRAYLERGEHPERPDHRARFFGVLARWVGRDYVRRHFGAGALRDFFQPADYNAMRETTGEDMESLFEAAATRENRNPAEIIWQFQEKGGLLFSPTPLLPGEERGEGRYAKVRIRRLEEGRWEILKGRGDGAGKAIEALRESPVVQEGRLLIRNEGWLGLRALRFGDFREIPADLYFSERLAALEKERGRSIEEFIWQFRKWSGGRLSSPTPLLPGEERGEGDYAKVRIRRLEEGRLEILKGWGGGAGKAIEALRESPAVQGGRLLIRNDGWLGLRALRFGDFREIPADLYFSEMLAALEKERGQPIREFIWQFLEDGGLLLSPSPLLPGEERGERHYAKVRIRHLKEGRWEILKGWGRGAGKAIEALRQNPAVVQGRLQIALESESV